MARCRYVSIVLTLRPVRLAIAWRKALDRRQGIRRWLRWTPTFGTTSGEVSEAIAAMVRGQRKDVSETLAQYLNRPPEDIAAQISGFKQRGMELASGIELGTALQIDRAKVRADCVARFDAERTVDAFERALYDAIARV